jgi:aspartyl-tRNA synthetase
MDVKLLIGMITLTILVVIYFIYRLVIHISEKRKSHQMTEYMREAKKMQNRINIKARKKCDHIGVIISCDTKKDTGSIALDNEAPLDKELLVDFKPSEFNDCDGYFPMLNTPVCFNLMKTKTASGLRAFNIHHDDRKVDKSKTKKINSTKTNDKSIDTPSHKNQKPRTHTDQRIKYTSINKITADDINKTMSFKGRVLAIRDHGNLIFLDIVDCVNQLPLNVVLPDSIVITLKNKNTNEIKRLNMNCYVTVTGVLEMRTAGTYRKDIHRTPLELHAKKINIISVTHINHPYKLDPDKLFMKRYIELCNTNDMEQDLADNLAMRSQIQHELREHLHNNHFIELQTPTLISDNLDRDHTYLPVTLQGENTYHLSNSPIEYHLLLMSAGYNRCYQIHKSFSADLKLSAKFESSKLEMAVSLPHIENIKNRTMNLIKQILQANNSNLNIHDVAQLSCEDALKKHGSPNPDLRIKTNLFDIDHLVKNSLIKPLARNANDAKCRVAAIVASNMTFSRSKIDTFKNLLKQQGTNLISIAVKDLKKGKSGLKSRLLKHMRTETILDILNHCNAKNGDTVFIIASRHTVFPQALAKLNQSINQDNTPEINELHPAWVSEFPLYQRDEKNGLLFTSNSPLIAPHTDDIERLQSNPTEARSSRFQLVINGHVIVDGAVYSHDLDTQLLIFNQLGYSQDTINNEYAHIIHALKHGCPPFANISIDIDKLCMLACETEDMNEVIAFPKTRSGRCHLMNKRRNEE